MSELTLNGLSGSQPIGAMAAFGLLRVCSQSKEFVAPRLSWSLKGDWKAVLTTECDLSPSGLVDRLVAWQHGRTRQRFLAWQDDIKTDPDAFAVELRCVIEEASATSRETADFFAAYASEHVTASTGDVKPTAFHMTAGQQQFLKSARALAESLDSERPIGPREARATVFEDVRSAFAEALFGPWRYEDMNHSLGWDPSREALHALSAIAPTKAKPSSVRAAVWLAFEALPLFPCVARGKKLATRAFSPDGSAFFWPVWEAPITIDTLKSLLASQTLVDSRTRDELYARGVKAVFRSARSTDANGRGIFRNAVLCPPLVRERDESMSPG